MNNSTALFQGKFFETAPFSWKVGEVVTVRKHSSMGCAVVSMTDVRVRQACGMVVEQKETGFSTGPNGLTVGYVRAVFQHLFLFGD